MTQKNINPKKAELEKRKCIVCREVVVRVIFSEDLAVRCLPQGYFLAEKLPKKSAYGREYDICQE